MIRYIKVCSLAPEHRSFKNKYHHRLIIEQACGVLIILNENNFFWTIDPLGNKCLFVDELKIGTSDLERALSYMDGFVGGISYDRR